MAASGSDQAVAPEPTPAPAAACPLATLDPQLLMAALRGNSELLKHLLHLKDEKEECPQATLRPELFMAARRGDSKQLKDLLQLKDEEEDANAVRDGGILETKGATIKEGDLLLQVVDSDVDDDDRPSPSPSSASPSSASHDDDAARQQQPPPPPPPVEPLDADGVTTEGDSLLHVVAACGDGNNFLECAEIIYKKANRLLVACNTNGDTPLHCAASAGNFNMISRLIHLAGRESVSVEALVKMRNKCGETALQQAVRAPRNNEECINRLMAVDSDLACIPPEEEGSSALYLAISTGEMEIAQHLYAKTQSKGDLSYSGPDGTNVLHAAVSSGREKAVPMVLEWLSTATDMRQPEGQGHADLHRDVLWQLTSQGDKENGSTPLHLAASLAGLPLPVVIMYRTHPYLSRAKLLLQANKSTAYQPDKRGLYPIHVAACASSLHMVKALLRECPDCATLRDAKGRTFLHVAVEERWEAVVRYVWRQSTSTWHESPADAAIAGFLSSILNAQDINGDTPLHRAVHTGSWRIYFCLAQNQMVRLDVKNKEGLTPIDVAWRAMPLRTYYAWDSRIHIRNHLLKIGAPYGTKNWGDLFHQRSYILPKQDEDKMSENLTAAAQVLGLFSVLITTVTFASAFTLPGGYLSAGDATAVGRVAGTPVLAGPRKSYAFDVFVLSNAMAFLCSLFATSLLLYAGVPSGTLTERFATLNYAYTFMWQGGRCLLAAFAMGLYVALFPVARTIAISLLVLVILFGAGFMKYSDGTHYMFVIERRRRGQLAWELAWDFLLYCFIYALENFWSYIIIFGLAAIHKGAK